MRKQNPRFMSSRSGQSEREVADPGQQIVGSHKPEIYPAAFYSNILIIKDANALTRESIKHHVTIGPVVVVAEHGVDPVSGAQCSKCPRAAWNVAAGMCHIISGECDQVRLEIIGFARGFRDLIFAQKWAVVNVRKLNYPETIELIG